MRNNSNLEIKLCEAYDAIQEAQRLVNDDVYTDDRLQTIKLMIDDIIAELNQ